MAKLLNKTTPIDRFSRPFLNFLHVEAAGGIVLLICTLIALFLANSPWQQIYTEIWQWPLAISLADWKLSLSVGLWINDALMAIFFFVVGLEIKRELVAGELRDRRAALLPFMAAIGGMLAPALIYIFALGDNDGRSGWGIPMATDIAFVVGFLSLLGKRVPHGLKIFILSLAIVDDLGAIIVIAAFYSSNISFAALAAGAVGLGVCALLNQLGVRRVPIYVVVGSLVWLAFLASGVHPTVAGVMLGLLTPASAWIGDKTFSEALSSWTKNFRSTDAKKSSQVTDLITVAKETVSPLERLEYALHPWVAFVIMPVFALANAGVPLAIEAATSPVALAVALGLTLGKPIGILFFSWIAVQFMGSRLPAQVNWKIMLGAAFLAGIGFTMSIFIASLALEGNLLVDGKVGTMLGSAVSAVAGLTILYVFLPRKAHGGK